jgi:hypothetical protein
MVQRYLELARKYVEEKLKTESETYWPYCYDAERIEEVLEIIERLNNKWLRTTIHCEATDWWLRLYFVPEFQTLEQMKAHILERNNK